MSPPGSQHTTGGDGDAKGRWDALRPWKDARPDAANPARVLKRDNSGEQKSGSTRFRRQNCVVDQVSLVEDARNYLLGEIAPKIEPFGTHPHSDLATPPLPAKLLLSTWGTEVQGGISYI